MCGIVGLVGKQQPEWLTQMNARLAHRGPDDSGEYRDQAAGVGLAMRRLSIIDLAGGHQPMPNRDETCWIVHNGEIYNAPELRAELIQKGYTFKTSHSDTEVLLQLYQQKGEQMLADLNGMFSFVIYDRAKRRLFGARDRFGIKPLYLLKHPDGLAFASEAKALLTLPWMQREINLESLFHYMSLLYVPGQASIWKQLRRLPPSHYFTYDLVTRVLSTRSYWDFKFESVKNRSEAEWIEQIQGHLKQAIKRWSLSDVPVGCSLSGGLDSSALVGYLSQMGHQVKTYSLGFAGNDEQTWNELPLAREVAQRWGTEHHEMILEPKDLLNDLVQMVWSLDEPYGGGLPSWTVFQFMRQEVTVGLTGSGGDELFGNYGKFAGLEEGIGGRFKSTARQRSWARISESPARYYFHTWYYFSDAMKRDSVFESRFFPQLSDTANYLDAVYQASPSSQPRDAIAYTDFKTQLPDEFLLMTDRFSMAYSLEARVPYLDHTLVELIFSMPAQMRTRAQDPKYLLKKVAQDLLPPSVLQGKKRGFVIPIRLWLRQELRPLTESLLSRERLAQQQLFRPDFYDRFVQPHLKGKADYTWQIWPALMFQLWYAIFIEDKAIDPPTWNWKDLPGSPRNLVPAHVG